MATVEIDERWIDELRSLNNGKQFDLSNEVESAVRYHLFKLRQSKIADERQYYEENHTEIAEKHLGQYVAIHNHAIVDSDADGRSLSARLRQKLGRTPVAIIFVEEHPDPPIISLRAPRLGKKM